MTEANRNEVPPANLLTSDAGVTSSLVLERIVKRFGGVTAVDDVSLEVGPTERVSIIGPNGAGKTTLFRLIAGDFSPSEGRIRLLGHDVSHLAPHRRARLGLSRTFQVSNLFLDLTCAENLRVALQARHRLRWQFWRFVDGGDAIGHRVTELLRMVGLELRRDHPAKELSHGEQRQLEIAVALAPRPSFLLLDEPAAGLSQAERSSLKRTLSELPQDLPFLLIEHDMSFALSLSDRVLCLNNGRQIALGRPEQVRQDEAVREVYLGRSG